KTPTETCPRIPEKVDNVRKGLQLCKILERPRFNQPADHNQPNSPNSTASPTRKSPQLTGRFALWPPATPKPRRNSWLVPGSSGILKGKCGGNMRKHPKNSDTKHKRRLLHSGSLRHFGG